MSRKSLMLRILAVAAGLPTLLAAQRPEQVTLSGSRIGIWNVAGKVTLSAGSGSDVQVTVTRHGDDAAKLQVAHGPIDGRETLRIIYPGDEVVYRTESMGHGRWRTEFDIRDDGTFGSDDDHGDSWHGGRRMRVSSAGDGLDASADLDIKVPAGQQLQVTLAVGTVNARNVNGKLTIDTHGADVTASALQGDVDISTGSGDVAVDGMTGPLAIDVGSGDVVLANMKGSTLDIDTGSGDVRGTGIAADALKVDTGSGGVGLDGLVAQDANIDVGSGDVDLKWTVDPGSIDIDSGSGDVRLTMPAGSGGAVDLESSSGDINSDFEVRTQHIERDALRGTFGDGQGRIKVETGSGDISLLKR